MAVWGADALVCPGCGGAGDGLGAEDEANCGGGEFDDAAEEEEFEAVEVGVAGVGEG